MLIYLGLIRHDEVVNITLNLSLFHLDRALEDIRLVILVQIQIAFEESVIQIEGCQFFQILFECLSTELLDDMQQEVLHLVDIIDKDLQEVLYPDLLLF